MDDANESWPSGELQSVDEDESVKFRDLNPIISLCFEYEDEFASYEEGAETPKKLKIIDEKWSWLLSLQILKKLLVKLKWHESKLSGKAPNNLL